MMHNDKIVCAIKVNGQILRETGDTVSLPFGSEYSIILKNLNSVRAQVGVSVDGTDATDGTRLIIAPNSTLELERFIKNGNLNAGNRFKFIERTAGVESHRGIGAEDGLIRVEAWREHVQQYVDVPIVRQHYYDECYPVPRPYWSRPYWWGPHYTIGSATNSVNIANVNLTSSSSPIRSKGIPRRPSGPQARGGGIRAAGRPQAKGASAKSSPRMNTMFAQQEVERNDAGITVAGSESHQQFFTSSGFALEPNSVVIVLRLRGEVGGKVVATPVTVNFKPICVTCGKSNKAGMNFCGGCGTALQLI